ncbi:anti-sigma factor family protein [Pseudonocardia sp. CA-107938]|uniref:anti-sigma factor family protein n=1 Tax=Pseudonocardia sp. CA-107938 TaxID=3240021 RepID=UPI003D8B3764
MTAPHPEPGDLSAFALGLLDAAQAGAVARHLDGCAVCRREQEELREMAQMLGELPPEMLLDGPPEGGDLLLARTVRQVRGEVGKRGRRRVLALAAASVIGVAAAIGGGVLIGRVTAPPTVSSIQAAGTRVLDGASGAVSMKATVSPAAEWVRLAVTVSGVPRGKHCKLIVVRKDGSREVAGSWTVGPRGEGGGVTVDGAADVRMEDVRSVNVEDTDGTVYVAAVT